MKAQAGFLCAWGVLLLFSLPGMAKDTAGYHYLTIHRFPRIQIIIPKAQREKRLYIRSNYSHSLAKAQAAIDRKHLISAIGNSRSAFIPVELAQGYHQSFTEVSVFPTALFQNAQKQVVLNFTLDNDQNQQITIQGKLLAQIRSLLPQ